MDDNDNTDEKELSRYEMLASFLTDDALNDVTLKGSDGVTVKANKTILSARSKVFRGMLLGKFQESSAPVVELDLFQGRILQAVVEYILTDSVTVLPFNTKKRKNYDDAPSIHLQEIQSLVSLAEAASYFGLPGLGRCVMDAFHQKLEHWPSSSFALLQVCRMAGPSVPPKLIQVAETSIRETPINETTLKDCECLSANVLEEILKDKGVEMTEFQLFQVLAHWAQATDGSFAHQDDDHDRQETAMRLSKYICLNKIDPDDLATKVTSSGLFTPEELSEAYKYQALAAKQTHSDLFATPRKAKWTTEITENSGPLYKIKVEGAGVDEVNGIYVKDGYFNEFPRYSMQGQRQGYPCTYWLFATPARSSQVFWYISVPDGDQPGTDADIDFYRAKKSDDNFPPSEGFGWKFQSSDGVEPPPKLLYKFMYEGNH